MQFVESQHAPGARMQFAGQQIANARAVLVEPPAGSPYIAARETIDGTLNTARRLGLPNIDTPERPLRVLTNPEALGLHHAGPAYYPADNAVSLVLTEEAAMHMRQLTVPTTVFIPPLRDGVATAGSVIAHELGHGLDASVGGLTTPDLSDIDPRRISHSDVQKFVTAFESAATAEGKADVFAALDRRSWPIVLDGVGAIRDAATGANMEQVGGAPSIERYLQARDAILHHGSTERGIILPDQFRAPGTARPAGPHAYAGLGSVPFARIQELKGWSAAEDAFAAAVKLQAHDAGDTSFTQYFDNLGQVTTKLFGSTDDATRAVLAIATRARL